MDICSDSDKDDYHVWFVVWVKTAPVHCIGAQWSKAADWEQKSTIAVSNPSHEGNFSTPDYKKSWRRYSVTVMDIHHDSDKVYYNA